MVRKQLSSTSAKKCGRVGVFLFGRRQVGFRIRTDRWNSPFSSSGKVLKKLHQLLTEVLNKMYCAGRYFPISPYLQNKCLTQFPWRRNCELLSTGSHRAGLLKEGTALAQFWVWTCLCSKEQWQKHTPQMVTGAQREKQHFEVRPPLAVLCQYLQL